MSVRLLVAVGLRFFAVSLCFGTLVALIGMKAGSGQDFGVSTALWAVFVLTVLAVAVVLWMLARPLSGLLVSGLPGKELAGLSAADLVIAGCALMGLWWLRSALSGLFYLWLQAQGLAEVSGRSAWASLDAGGHGQVLAQVLELAFALLLLLRPRQVAGWVLRSPSAGAASADP